MGELWKSNWYVSSRHVVVIRKNLTSWRGRDDLGSGNFTLMLNTAENQNAIIVNKEGRTIYWKSSVGFYSFLTTIGFQNDKNFENDRLVMNFSGKIEEWTKSTIGTWFLYAAEPSNNCSVYNVCGNFGSCNLNNKLKCKCLLGFKPYDAQKWHSGDFSDGCIKNLMSCGNTFLSLKMMNIWKNLEQRSWVENETKCKELCLKHCDCKCDAPIWLIVWSVMSPTSGIYWVELGFINNYKESQLWLVMLRYSADMTNAFSWVVTYGIRVGLVTLCGFGDTTHNEGPNEDVRDISLTSGIYWVELGFINNGVYSWL